jgi:energy-coupling factor transporter ATP-binding protein EcfA2
MEEPESRFIRGAEIPLNTGPVLPGYVELDGMSVVMGPNGAGKSFLLRELARTLRTSTDSVIVVEVSHAELDALITTTRMAAESDAASGPEDLAELMTGVPFTLGGLPDATLAGDAGANAIRDLRGQLPEDSRGVEKLLSDLAESRLLMRALGSEYWCANPSAGTRDAIHRLEADLPAPATGGPIPVVAVGAPGDDVFPRLEILTAPIGLAQAAKRSRDAILSALVPITHWPWDDTYSAPEDREAADLDWDELERRAGKRIWLQDPDSPTPSLRAGLEGTCQLMGMLATALSPPFVRGRFELRFEVEPLIDWPDTGPQMKLSVAEPPRNRVFSVDEIADGFKLWIEIALAEATLLFGALSWRDDLPSAHSQALGGALARVIDGDHDETSFEQLFRWPQIGDTFTELPRDSQDFVVEMLLAVQSHTRIAYLVDEPERHLHPQLQRVAARWLQDLVLERGSQVIVATHSPYFLRGGPKSAFTYLHPTSRGSLATSFDPGELDAFGLLAEEMGFDRGELLFGLELVLFVEGEADRALLTAMFAQELHHAGVVVVPIHGAKDAEGKGIVDSEMMLRFTSAKVAIMLDKITSADFSGLVSSRAARDDVKQKKSKTGIELRHLARLIQRADDLERPLQLVPLDGEDIFDLVSEELLRERFGFPGHVDARRLVTERQGRWKDIYREQWGIDVLDISTFNALGSAMRDRGLIPAELVAILDEVIRLAAGE